METLQMGLLRNWTINSYIHFCDNVMKYIFSLRFFLLLFLGLLFFTAEQPLKHIFKLILIRVILVLSSGVKYF
jgi:hypothetical protein